MSSYREPSVQITQVQETVTVNAGLADLMAGIIGPAYEIVELNDYDYGFCVGVSGVTPSSVSLQVSGLQPNDTVLFLKDFDTATGTVAPMYIEMVSKDGKIIPFLGNMSYTRSTNTLVLTGGGGKTLVQLLPQISSDTPSFLRGYRPKIAYRAQYIDRAKELFVSTTEDVKLNVGKLDLENPLGFAAKLMLLNNPNQFMVFPIGKDDSDQVNFSNAFAASRNMLDNSDVYSFAVLSKNLSNVLQPFITWVIDRSKPENGHPCKLYMSPEVTWYNNNAVPSGKQLAASDLPQTKFSFSLDLWKSTGKKYTAQAISSQNSQIRDKRITSIYPDFAWVNIERNVLQCKPNYVELIGNVEGGKAVVANTIVLSNNDIIYAGTIITEDIFNTLVDKNKYPGNTIKVWYPIAGYYLAVQQASLVSALNPSDPKTQQPVAGIDKITHSESFFGKENTNIIAGGGTTVIVQPSLSVLPASRHHLTTDTTTTQTREDNVVHQVDAVTINYYKAISPLIGRYKQTTKYFKILRATLTAYAELFKTKEFVKDIQVLEVKESTADPDKVLVVLRVFPYYAANYIDITLFY